MFVGALVAVFLLPFVLELLRLMSKQYDRYIKKKCVGKQVRQTFCQQVVRTITFATQLGIAYLLMMLAMTFNGYVLIAIMLGSFMAYFFFQRDLHTGGEDKGDSADMHGQHMGQGA